MAKARVAVLISGAGTNMAALLYAAKADTCPYELVFVGSNDPDAPGLKIAEAEGIATWGLSHKGMNRDAFDALVDAQLRVHGLAGLRIADASIMPTLPSSNTNAPSIMIGERAADWALRAAEHMR